jgi:hypothetical protein
MTDRFNDWRRLTLFVKVLEITYHGLLTPTQMQELSEEAQDKLKALESLQSK